MDSFEPCISSFTRLFLILCTLQIPWSVSSQTYLVCTVASPSCEASCGTNSCTCSDKYSRCACSDQASALLRDGRCISTLSAKNFQAGESNTTCQKDDLQASVLLYAGAAPSPEVQLENLEEGRPSPAMISILHWSTAAAMGLQSEKVRIPSARIIWTRGSDNSSSMEERPGTVFFDVAFSVCASTSDGLVAGGLFERRLIQSWQSFAAFAITSVRVLELQEVGALRGTATPPIQMTSYSSNSTHNVERDGNQIWHEIWNKSKEHFWFWPVVGLSCILLCVATWSLLRAKCSKDVSDAARWRDVAPTAHLEKDHFEAQNVFEGTTGTLVSVAFDFDPTSDSGKAFASSGGLDTGECLAVAKGDTLEVFARGNGWLYGRRSCDGSFGYLPEPFVCYRAAVVTNLGVNEEELAGARVEEVVIAQMV